MHHFINPCTIPNMHSLSLLPLCWSQIYPHLSVLHHTSPSSYHPYDCFHPQESKFMWVSHLLQPCELVLILWSFNIGFHCYPTLIVLDVIVIFDSCHKVCTPILLAGSYAHIHFFWCSYYLLCCICKVLMWNHLVDKNLFSSSWDRPLHPLSSARLPFLWHLQHKMSSKYTNGKKYSIFITPTSVEPTWWWYDRPTITPLTVPMVEGWCQFVLETRQGSPGHFSTDIWQHQSNQELGPVGGDK